LTSDPGKIQRILPLADLAERLRNGVDHMLFEAELQLLQLIMEDEGSAVRDTADVTTARSNVGERHQGRSSTARKFRYNAPAFGRARVT
jgi:hypothetical protein